MMCDSRLHSPSVGFYEETCDEEEWDRILSDINDSGDIIKITPSKGKEHIYNYGDVRVVFPYKAYVSQEQMMEKLIRGAQESLNCLLESPTGTGKTAALLCGLLAFLRWSAQTGNYGQDIAARYVEDAGGCSCGLITDPENTKVTMVKSKYKQKFRLEAVTMISTSSFSSSSSQLESTAQESQMEVENQSQGSPNKIKKMDSSITTVGVKNMTDLCRYCIKKHFKEHGPPKIYYATRTHSQIAQVVKQLKNTHYSRVNMTILGSRLQYCLNSKLKGDVSQDQAQPKPPAAMDGKPPLSLDERCKTLKKNYFANRKEEKRRQELNETGDISQTGDVKEMKEECPYFAESYTLTSTFRDLQQNGAWDIEDIVEYGNDCEACPYYGSQALHEKAEIVFCPYNYLIYPGIRENANVKLTNSIIVFDEAHNIEDICRSAASFCIDHDRLDIYARRSFDLPLSDRKMTIPAAKLSAVQHFSHVLRKLSSWILSNGKKVYVKPNDSQSCISFLNIDILNLFKDIGLGPETLDTHQNMFHVLKSDDEFDDEPKKKSDKKKVEEPYFKVASDGMFFVEGILSVLQLIFANGLRRLQDYKVVLVNTLKQSSTSSPENQHHKYLLDIICLNPAVAFEPIKNAARSIIVASGTLSPMMSFSSELETPFPIDLSADHVVNRSQVWAGVVKCGPLAELRLTKKFQELPEIQDEIGNVILQVCEVIPHGVLVFLPSYSFMNTLKARWSISPTNTPPVLSRIRKCKTVYFEESKNKEIFQKDMKNYFGNIKTPSSSSTGCILFAVFRGKVSEGIDFADNQARAVITVGIPYSNCFAYEITSKKAYNDNKRKPTPNTQATLTNINHKNGVLSGSEWYKVQAFRAINQGFGRCIRHKNDWGAIIMIDARLTESNNNEYLSGWVKQHMRTFDDFKTVAGSLVAFVERQQLVEEEIQSLNEYDDDEAATQLCEMDTKDSATQYCKENGQVSSRPVPSCSSSKSAVASDLDSSAYSLDESEFEDDGHDDIFRDTSIQAAIDLHEQTTLPVDVNSSSNSDVSYNSESEANLSVDMILGTP